MPQTINKIQRAFNKSSYQYDTQTAFHRDIADKLLAQVCTQGPSRILDVGCGTGYLTIKARENFPQAEVIGLDFSQNMLDGAHQKNEHIIWTLSDFHRLPFDHEHFDLVISNLAYQWAEDVSYALREAWRVLVPGKVLAATLFGFDTCYELWTCLDEATLGTVHVNRLPSVPDVLQALRQAGFKSPKVAHEYLKLNFDHMHSLLAWLKAIGANNLLREGFVGPQALLKAAAIYQQRFSGAKGIEATFEVIWIYAQK